MIDVVELLAGPEIGAGLERAGAARATDTGLIRAPATAITKAPTTKPPVAIEP
ncbi:MAG: hypothetical protein WAL35_02795 [Acidimicrobiales bacterium]